jgi:hypothetical protein
MKPQVVKSMENEGGNDQGDTGSRKRVSKREFLHNGQEVDRIEEASAARYTLLGDGGGNCDSPELGQPGKLATMCAIFGFHTKVGNVANTVLNNKEDPGTTADAKAAIDEFIAMASSGTWAERATGAPGAAIDKDALAGAIVAVAMASGKVTADQEGATYAKVRGRLDNEPAYVRAARQVPDVAREYATRVGKASKSIDDLI